MTQSNQDQTVEGFMTSLKFVWDEEQEAWINEEEGIGIDPKPALFFYTICQKVEREAEHKAESKHLMWMSALLRSTPGGKIYIPKRYFAEASHKDVIVNYTEQDSPTEVYYIELDTSQDKT